MPFNIYSDGEILTAEDLNEDNNSSLDVQTNTPQTVNSAVTFGGLVTVPLTVGGLLTLEGATIENVTVVGSGTTYTVAASDRYVLINTGAAITVSLPAAPVLGRIVTIKDIKGLAGAGAPITINGNPTTLLLDGVTHFTISANYGVTACFGVARRGHRSELNIGY